MSHLCPARVREWRQCRCPRPDDQKSIESPSRGHDELTVDDVLGVLRPCVNAWAVTLPSDAYVAAWGPKDKTDGFALFVDDLAPVAEGTLRDVLTEAKRRGLLG